MHFSWRCSPVNAKFDALIATQSKHTSDPMWTDRFLFFSIMSARFGIEKSRVGFGETPYLDRYIIYFWPFTFRLHKFWRGDDDRAPHDHPFAFITFPFTSYVEQVFEPFGATIYRRVGAWRPHFRKATFRHIVIGPCDWKYLIARSLGKIQLASKPFWTFVISSQRLRGWGFWPRNGLFIPHREWEEYCHKSIDKARWHG